MHDIEHGYPTSRHQIDIGHGATLRTPPPTTRAPRTTPRGFPTIEGDTRCYREDRHEDKDKNKDRNRDRDRTRDGDRGRSRCTEHVRRDRM